MEADTEIVPRRVRERVARSELLEADEHVVAYVSGRRKLELTGSAKADLYATLPGNVRSFRAVILTDRRLYVCSIKFEVRACGGAEVCSRHVQARRVLRLDTGHRRSAAPAARRERVDRHSDRRLDPPIR